MKLLIVDDSMLARVMLKDMFNADPNIKVIGEAVNGEQAIRMSAELKPDVVIMDVNMPIMDGIEATRRIMAATPVPILIFSSSLNTAMGFAACQAGAVDVLSKPGIDQLNDPQFMESLKQLLLTLGTQHKTPCEKKLESVKIHTRPSGQKEILVIGASTGGPKAVREVLEGLLSDLSVPAVLVQHMETGFDTGFVEWLQEASPLKIVLVKDTTIPQKGSLYVAPCDKHLVFEGRRLILDNGPRVLNQKPSVDKLFSSAAAVFGSRTLGLLLTGMGQDGARGCLDIVKAGGYTLVEDASSAAIFGMPKAAIDMGGASRALPLCRIPDAIGALL